ncbi:hypothetical protein [Pseudomonas sp. St316]|uniref:hypothetical protein n=1 Tax=Pseudomonas sp. St316 TaxID=2678257 RepID=UPI001BB33530|nr:hypothetical protein [Pseudomonas sp. St316]BBP60392.1 hypothetical protein PHLH4_39820 [Pseudomonas sp. St316]
MKILVGVTVAVWFLMAWFTHLFVCFKAASWGFLIAGAIFFPVAVVHGTGAWFGAW